MIMKLAKKSPNVPRKNVGQRENGVDATLLRSSVCLSICCMCDTHSYRRTVQSTKWVMVRVRDCEQYYAKTSSQSNARQKIHSKPLFVISSRTKLKLSSQFKRFSFYLFDCSTQCTLNERVRNFTPHKRKTKLKSNAVQRISAYIWTHLDLRMHASYDIFIQKVSTKAAGRPTANVWNERS